MSIVTTPELQRAAPYVQIADHYRRLIETGVLAAGDRLPAVASMALTWRVAPGTAHRAVRELKREGLVVTSQRGTVVADGGAA